MRKTVLVFFSFLFLIALLPVAPAHAWNAAVTPQDNYLTPPSAYPSGNQPNYQQPMQGAVVYSSEEYPTAQGRYLALPPGYQSAPAPQPVTVSPPPPPQYQYQPQPQPPQYRTIAASTPQPAVIVSAAPAQYPAQYQPAPAAQPSRQPQMIATTFDQLPSFPDDHSLDPRYVPKPPVKELPSTDPASLLTRTGFELGLQLSGYRYQEFDPSGQWVMRITGPTLGVTLTDTQTYADNWFLAGDLRLAYGVHDYTGGDINLFSQTITPSTHNGIGDFLADLRLMGGKDFIIPNAFWHAFTLDLSPYIGLGFRYLYDDSRGDDSNGVPGYERYSHYLYIPIGVTPRVKLNDTLRLSLNMELDPLLYGWQVSSLGESIPGAGDVTDTQKSGYGLRGSVMFEWPSWAFGPFFNFWDIGQSTTDCADGLCGDEPHNQTIEFGVQGRYRF